MFKIGEFSKIGQVSMRMLRHYDEIGLFEPARVDPDTGYRFYSASQLPRLNRIVALKGLGLTLEEVRRALSETVTVDEIKHLLETKRTELDRHLTDERRRLERIESRLRQIERDSEVHRQEVVLKAVAAQQVLATREIAPDFDAMDRLIVETHAAVRRAAVGALGPGIALFYDPAFEEDHVDWELGFVVEGVHPDRIELDEHRAMVARSLPGVEQMACLMYEGPFEGLHLGYGALGAWIEANEMSISSVGREVFWHLDLERPEHNVTEIQFPVQPLDPHTV